MQPELPAEIYPLIADHIRDRKTWLHLLLANSLVYDAVGFHGRIRARKRLPPPQPPTHDCPHDSKCSSKFSIGCSLKPIKRAVKSRNRSAILEAALMLADRAPCECSGRYLMVCPDCKYIYCDRCAHTYGTIHKGDARYGCPKCKDIVWFDDGKTVRKDALLELYRQTDVGYCFASQYFVMNGRDKCQLCNQPHRRTDDAETQFEEDITLWGYHYN